MDKIDKIIICLIFVLIIIGIPAAWMLETHKPYTETVVLERQYLGNITNSIAGDCNNCLIMDVSHQNYDKTYYFAGENIIRSDLIIGNPMKVNWKYVWRIGEYRIRNIYQPTPKNGFD